MALPISRSVHVSEVIIEIKEARINFCPFVIELEIISFASCHRVRVSIQLQRQLSISFWSRIFEIDFTARSLYNCCATVILQKPYALKFIVVKILTSRIFCSRFYLIAVLNFQYYSKYNDISIAITFRNLIIKLQIFGYYIKICSRRSQFVLRW